MTTKKLTSVFIVEDSAIERSMLTDHLSKYPNLEIKEFASGDSCHGLEILSKLKEICPNTQVIMLTSVTNEKVMELAKQKGALDYVVKSAVSYQQLDSVLQKHFELQEQN